MVEGGGMVHTQFLTDNLADELQLVVAPFFVGDSRAPRFVRDGLFPWNPGRACDARRGARDRRRGAAALRALAAIPGRLSWETDDGARCGSQGRISRSACSTVTSSCPALAWASRRRV